MKEKIILDRMAYERLLEGEKKYNGKWMDLGEDELLKMTMEELADVINYVKFACWKGFINEYNLVKIRGKINELKHEIEKAYKEEEED